MNENSDNNNSNNNSNNNNSPNKWIDLLLGLLIFLGLFFILPGVMGIVYDTINNPIYPLIASILLLAIVAIAGVKLSKKGYKTAGSMTMVAVILISFGLLIFGSCALTFRIG